MSWQLLLVFTVLIWGIYDILYGYVQKYLPIMTTMILIALGQILLAAPLLINEIRQPISISKKGLILALIMGMILVLGNVAFFQVFKKGASISIAVPFVAIGIYIVGSLWGIFVLKEPFTFRYLVGSVLAISGVILISLKR